MKEEINKEKVEEEEKRREKGSLFSFSLFRKRKG
jgi:hypothetical protein